LPVEEEEWAIKEQREDSNLKEKGKKVKVIEKRVAKWNYGNRGRRTFLKIAGGIFRATIHLVML
jgi:hypothetical protein